jgi:TetR/AcrR family transcriptional regulator, transcriptional repressor for nem operon
MTTNVGGTRERLMDAAEELFLVQGYGGTSVDAILERTGLTKGAFFHHFGSKRELAVSLLERHAAADRAHLASNLSRAEHLSRDPLQQLLIVVGLYEEEMAELTEPFPGCLFASYAYQAGLFDEEIHGIIQASFEETREVVGAKVEAALAQHPPRLEVAAPELAEMLLSVLEGAFILSRTLVDPGLTARQLRQFRNYLELLFGVV